MTSSSPSSPNPQNDGGLTQNDNSEKEPTIAAMMKKLRPVRSCTKRAAANSSRASNAPKPKSKLKRKTDAEEGSAPSSPPHQCTPLVPQPEPSQLPRWQLRAMSELAAVLNFLHVFRPVLNIQVEFSVEELETALIMPNDTLADLHIPLLKAIPPIIRMALTRDTWMTVLCRKFRKWWHWVADGEELIVASNGAEVEAYKSLDPGVRVTVLKALCDIRAEQEDIRSYIDYSLKQGVQLSTFRKERIGGDSHGVSYWYEDDPVIGHRLYREIRKVEVKELRKGKTKGSRVLPHISLQWETVATNLDEFQDVSEKLFNSKNRTESSLGKKLKNDMLPEIEKIHKRKERLLKKQQREALLLDNLLIVDGLGGGRSLRDRKPVTYTFDDYDRSINEAIKVTKHKSSPEPVYKREPALQETSTNGKVSGPSHVSSHVSFSAPSPSSPNDDNFEEDHKSELVDRRSRRRQRPQAPSPSPSDDDFNEDYKSELLDRRSRRRQRPQRYSEREFIEDISENEANIDSDDDIVGEAIYDEDYLRKQNRRNISSSSSDLEGDEEYRWDDENDDEEEEEEEEEDVLSLSDDSDEPRKVRKLPGRTRRGTRLRAVDEIESGLRRSKRATRNRINYRQYELSDSETETEKIKAGKSNALDDHAYTSEDTSENDNYSVGSHGSEGHDDEKELEVNEPDACDPGTSDNEKNQPAVDANSPEKNEVEVVHKRRFLDLNQLAPGSGFDDGPSAMSDDLNQLATETGFDGGPSTMSDTPRSAFDGASLTKNGDLNQLAPGFGFDAAPNSVNDDLNQLAAGSSFDGGPRGDDDSDQFVRGSGFGGSPSSTKDKDINDF